MAVVDLYYHSVRLVAANLAWSAGLIGVAFIALSGLPLAAAILVPLLALPLAGVARLAALISRRQEVVLSDAWAEWPRQGPAAVVVGSAAWISAIVLFTNVVSGFNAGGPVGWALATLAAWGLVALWTVAFPIVVLLADPVRDSWPTAAQMRLAVGLLLAEPGTMARLAVALAALLVVSTLLFAALLTFAVALALLVAAHVVLPAADRLTDSLASQFPPVVTAVPDPATSDVVGA
jgi:hypothetical protein